MLIIDIVAVGALVAFACVGMGNVRAHCFDSREGPGGRRHGRICWSGRGGCSGLFASALGRHALLWGEPLRSAENKNQTSEEGKRSKLHLVSVKCIQLDSVL